jgi:histidine ammonia-lyase
VTDASEVGERVVVATGSDLSLADVVDVARRWVPVALGSGVGARLAAERAVVLAAVAAGEPVYGLTTGLGPRSTHRLSDADVAEFSARTVRGRATAVGPPLAVEVVRAALLARINAMAHGGSGVQPAIVDLLVGMLNQGVHPHVPGTGSIGASDLCQLAHVGLVVMGEGTASLGTRSGAGGEVLAWAGLAPIVLGPKDGLALCSANSISAGSAALAVADAEDLYLLAHAVAAASFEGFRANTSPLDPRVHQARPAPGQSESAALLRGLLAGGLLMAPSPVSAAASQPSATQPVASSPVPAAASGPAATGPVVARRLQDPISFRAVAQVHGALRAALGFVGPALDAEFNGSADNPLVLLGGSGSEEGPGELISNGNFHTPALALALDTLALALTQTGALSVARVQRLLSARMSGLPANLAPEGPGRSGFAAVIKTGQALLAEIRHLANPTSIDPRSGADDVEDDSTNAPLGARRVSAIVERLRLVLAVEALVATQAIELAAPAGVGLGAAMVASAVRSRVAALDDDRPCGPDIETVAELVLTSGLAAEVAQLPVQVSDPAVRRGR